MNSTVYDAIQAQAAPFVTATGVPISWPNQRITPPNDPGGNPLPYIYADITGISGEQRSMGAPGANFFRDDAFIRFHYMTPFGEGMDQTYNQIDQLRSLYRLAAFSGVQCLAPTPTEGTETDDGNWFISSFSVPFYLYFTG